MHSISILCRHTGHICLASSAVDVSFQSLNLSILVVLLHLLLSKPTGRVLVCFPSVSLSILSSQCVLSEQTLQIPAG